MAEERAYLPETPEELTAEWLSEALGGRVTDVSMISLGDGQGFMGDVLKLDLAGEGVPASVVAKIPKKANRVMGELLGVYEREIMFFRDFAHRVPLRIPKAYYSEFDRDAGSEKQREILRTIDKIPLIFSRPINFLGQKIAAAKQRRYMLLIEFLEGMSPGDQLVGLDAAGCEQVVRSIAGLHGEFWGQLDDELLAASEYFWLLPLDIDARLRHGLFKQNVEGYATDAPAYVHQQIDWLRGEGEALMRRFVADAPNTLLHCDLRLDNVVFDGDACAFIDWQLVRAGPAAYDIAYFLTSALAENEGQDTVDELLRAYLEALNRDDYDFARLRRDYERSLLLVLAMLSGTGDVDFTNERGVAMMAAWMRRLWARLDGVQPEGL